MQIIAPCLKHTNHLIFNMNERAEISLCCSSNIHLISWMHGFQYFSLFFGGYMYINLRSFNGTVTENLLDTADIYAFLDQIGCKGVPPHVRRDISFDSSQFRILF